MTNTLVEVLKVLVFTSVIYVWVVRYQNIVEEFKQFGYPSWFRDLVGILKISFVVMIMSHEQALVLIGASGICLLMMAALVTHFKVRSSLARMIPSFTLLCLSALILFLRLA